MTITDNFSFSYRQKKLSSVKKTMEAPLNSNCHARSNSLPSASHPLIVDVEDQLRRLSASEATTSSSALVVCQNLANLKDLYESFEGMLQLPLTHQSFSSVRQMEDILDGSLRLLDICSTSRDVFSQIKGCVLDLESSLRRRNGTESSIANEIKYFILTKQVNRIFKKCFGNTKRMQQNGLGDMAGMLREVEAISLTSFKSMYSLICPRISKTNGWSLVSKMIQHKSVCCGDKIDDVLNDLIKNKSSKGMEVIQVQKALKGLETLESTVQEIEEGLESVFRCLIKTRVSLLNILNN